MAKQVAGKRLRWNPADARLHPEAGPRDARIYRAVRSILDKGTVYYVLTDTPEQTTDIFRVLVDDTVVVGFELERSDPQASPTEIQTYSVHEYRKAIGGGVDLAELKMALELAQQELGR